MNLYTAKKQFEENIKLFANANQDPEKYNLYAGLINIADALIRIESALESIKRKLK